MDCNSLSTLLQAWTDKEISDDALHVLDEGEQMDIKQRQMLEISSHLEDAYHQLLEKIK